MSKTTKPLRTAIIGLSSTNPTTWAALAWLPALQTPEGQSRFKITALLNSSVSAAKSAVAAYNLPDTIHPHNDPESLAQDPDIDLVIGTTRVDTHYQTILPSIRAGKDVFVEWPIAHNMETINELVDTAKKSGSRVGVGLQRRWIPLIVKLREILKEGSLGKILSSDVKSYDSKTGGNSIIIGAGHTIDYVLSVVGELVPESVVSKMQLRQPDVKIKDLKTQKILETVRSDVPDYLSFQGTLTSTPKTAPTAADATLTFLYKDGSPFPGEPAFSWRIECEFGEIQVQTLASTGLILELAPADDPLTIKLRRFDTGEIEDVKWDEGESDIGTSARVVRRPLFAFADGAKEGEEWVGIEEARKRAVLLDGFLKAWEKSKM